MRRWYRCDCSACGASWFLHIDEDVLNVWTVALRMLEAHRQLTLDCGGGPDTIRVTVPRQLRPAASGAA